MRYPILIILVGAGMLGTACTVGRHKTSDAVSFENRRSSAVVENAGDVARLTRMPEIIRTVPLYLLGDLAALRQKAHDETPGDRDSPSTASVYESIRAAAEHELANPFDYGQEPTSPTASKDVADQYQEKILHHALTFLIDGKPQHFERARKMMLQVSAWQSWSHIYVASARQRAFYNGLDRDALIIGTSLAYNWLYPALSSDERDVIRHAVIQLGLKRIQCAMAGGCPGAPYFPFDAIANFNHSAVGAAALGIGSLAVGADHPDDAFLEPALRTATQFIQDSGAPDGSYPESTNYGSFALRGLQLFDDMLIESPRRQSLIAAVDTKKWMKKYNEYIIYAIDPSNRRAVQFNDESRGLALQSQRLMMCAKTYPGQRMGKLCQEKMLEVVLTEPSLLRGSIFNFFYYDPRRARASLNDLSRFKTFPDIGHAFYRSDFYDPASLFMAFKAERHDKNYYPMPSPVHEHRDGGHFVVMADGAQYVADPGYQLGPDWAGTPEDQKDAALNEFTTTSFGHNNLMFIANGALQAQDKLASRIVAVASQGDAFIIKTDLAASYPAALGLGRYVRYFFFADGDLTTVDLFEAPHAAAVDYRLITTDRSNRTHNEVDIDGARYVIQPPMTSRSLTGEFLSPVDEIVEGRMESSTCALELDVCADLHFNFLDATAPATSGSLVNSLRFSEATYVEKDRGTFLKIVGAHPDLAKTKIFVGKAGRTAMIVGGVVQVADAVLLTKSGLRLEIP